MQRGTWSFDDHTTSTWVPSESLGIPGPQRSTEPVRDESAVWDDPDEATRKLSAQDLARTVDSATDLNMDWDEDESTTCTYNPSHMAEAVGLPTVPADLDTSGPSSRQSIIQASPRSRMKTDPQLNAVEPRPTPRARTRSGTIPRATLDE